MHLQIHESKFSSKGINLIGALGLPCLVTCCFSKGKCVSRMMPGKESTIVQKAINIVNFF